MFDLSFMLVMMIARHYDENFNSSKENEKNQENYLDYYADISLLQCFYYDQILCGFDK